MNFKKGFIDHIKKELNYNLECSHYRKGEIIINNYKYLGVDLEGSNNWVVKKNSSYILKDYFIGYMVFSSVVNRDFFNRNVEKMITANPQLKEWIIN